MKNYFTILLIAILPIISCSTDKADIVVLKQETTIVENSKIADLDPAPNVCHYVELIAGQHYNAGIVSIRVETGFLIVTYETQGDWEIDETHLYVGELEGIPMTNSGNPKVGRFPYQGDHPDGTTNVEYRIRLNTIPVCVAIAAHASLTIDVPGEPFQQETAWGEGTSFPGRNWGMYFEHCLNGCPGFPSY